MMHDVGRPRAIALATAGGPACPARRAPLRGRGGQARRAGPRRCSPRSAASTSRRSRGPSSPSRRSGSGARRRSAPLYRGARAPTLHARIVTIARRYNDLLTPEPGLPPPPPDMAVATLAAELTDSADRTVLRMLVAALGLFPVGTVVQLSSDEIGEVVPASRPSVPGQPTVRLSMGPDGAVLDLARRRRPRARRRDAPDCPRDEHRRLEEGAQRGTPRARGPRLDHARAFRSDPDDGTSLARGRRAIARDQPVRRRGVDGTDDRRSGR